MLREKRALLLLCLRRWLRGPQRGHGIGWVSAAGSRGGTHSRWAGSAKLARLEPLGGALIVRLRLCLRSHLLLLLLIRYSIQGCLVRQALHPMDCARVSAIVTAAVDEVVHVRLEEMMLPRC